MSHEEYITQAAAAVKLRRSDRQLRRLAAAGRIRTRRALGGRVLYHAGDVEALAEQLADDDSPPPAASAEIVPSSDLARRVEVLTDALRVAEQRAAAAETALRLLPPPEQARRLESDAAEARAEVSALREMLAEVRGGARRAWQLVAVLLVLALLLAAALVVVALIR